MSNLRAICVDDAFYSFILEDPRAPVLQQLWNIEKLRNTLVPGEGGGFGLSHRSYNSTPCGEAIRKVQKRYWYSSQTIYFMFGQGRSCRGGGGGGVSWGTRDLTL